MFRLLHECCEFFKYCQFPYAVCGGYAFELFLNRKIRPHSDLDISIFDEDRKNIVDFMLNRGWNIYEYIHSKSHLHLISSSEDRKIENLHYIWAIKPKCLDFKIEPLIGEDNTLSFEIINDEQLHFDFIEIIFNGKNGADFICDKSKNIRRELSKSILHNGEIPYLSPELMLFIISNPAYMESDYHRDKNKLDFISTAPHLPDENRKWLINALEVAYPNGHEWLNDIKR